MMPGTILATPRKRRATTAVLAAAALAALSSVPAAPAGPIGLPRRVDAVAEARSLVAAERAFAHAAATRGTRAAFLAYLADDGIVFRPEPVNGKEWWRDRESGRSLLSWEPIFADVARAGDLGYTTGPWEFREKGASDRPALFGNYFTVWKKQADGSWKAVLDAGNANPAPRSQPTSVGFAADLGARRMLVTPSADPDSELAGLAEAARSFAEDAAARGPAVSYLAHTSDEIRLLRAGRQPIVGRLAAQRFLLTSADSLSWQPSFTEVSRSADLGYDYGRYRLRAKDPRQPAEEGNYARLWKRQPGGGWKVALDLLVPVPPPAPRPKKG